MKLNVVSKAAVSVGGLFLFLGSLSMNVTAEPFAPRPQIPADITDNYQAKSARDSVIPEAARVGIPAYPGAVVIRTFAVKERPPKYEGLPIIELMTTDDYETVIAFYKRQLSTWKNAELMSAYYFAQHGNLKNPKSHMSGFIKWTIIIGMAIRNCCASCCQGHRR